MGIYLEPVATLDIKANVNANVYHLITNVNANIYHLTAVYLGLYLLYLANPTKVVKHTIIIRFHNMIRIHTN